MVFDSLARFASLSLVSPRSATRLREFDIRPQWLDASRKFLPPGCH
jgi:hypothetical protein